MKKSKLMKALLVFGMSMVTATAIVGITACSDEHTHVDENKDGKCDICSTDMIKEDDGGETLKVAVEKVELNTSSLTLEIGGEETLTATVTPDTATDKTVTWTVEPAGIVTVTNGKVKALAAGDAVVTATADGKKATCNVKVNAPEPKPEVTEEEWSQILEGLTNFTFDTSSSENEVVNTHVEVDGDKTLIDTGSAKHIYVKDGENYYQYTFADDAWTKADSDSATYGQYARYGAELVSMFKDDYETFDYVDGVYTKESLDKTEGAIGSPINNIEITFDHGVLVSLGFEVNVGTPEEPVTAVYEITAVGSTTIELPKIDDGNQGGETPDPDPGDENVPEITEWASVGDPIYGEVHENDADYIYHHIFFNDADAKAYDFDNYEATVKVDGKDGEIVASNPMSSDDITAHVYHLHIRIKANKYQTAEFAINFKKDGKTVAIGTYTRVGDKEVVLDNETLSISKDDTEPTTISVLKINGSTDFTDKTISWSIADTEGTGVASIPENSNGASVEVTALTEGKATLTCTIGEGADAFSTTCVITVVAGEVKDEDPLDVSGQLFEQEVYGAYYINIRLECDADLGGKIDSVEVTATMDGEPTTARVHNVYNTSPKYVQIQVNQDWSHDYVFTLNYKNAGGKVIATGTFNKSAPKSINLDKTNVNLTLKDGEAVTETLTATTKKIEGTLQWSIDDDSVATITDNGDGTLTVTAVAKGTATVTISADGITKTCTVNVIEEGEEVTVPTVTVARIHEVYGGDVHCGVVLDGTDALASTYAEVAGKFAYVKVNGVKNNDMKDMFAFGADGSYRVNVFMGGAVQKGVDYVFEICDADGNILLKTVALQWN